MKTITFFNNKGGVGKTTLAVNIASFFSIIKNKRILFLDADPQANSTQMIISEERWSEFYDDGAKSSTIMSFLNPIYEGDANVDLSARVLTAGENKFGIDLIPGHPKLAMIEDILSQSWNDCNAGNIGGFRRTNWLKAISTYYKDQYDFLFIDVGPSLGALNRSVLLNSDFIITPMGSDIFSLIGISNISSWISNWMDNYQAAIDVLRRNVNQTVLNKYDLNYNLSQTTRLIGFSIQQYVTKSFKEGRRPVASYDKIIQKIPEEISETLGFLIYNGLTVEALNLGDVPYLYSLVPLAQTAHAPMYCLTSGDGVVGSQGASVKKYKAMLTTIVEKILKNLGE